MSDIKITCTFLSILPEVCEVTEPGLQDPFLFKSGFYQDLVNLPWVIESLDRFDHWLINFCYLNKSGGRQNNPQFYMIPMFPSTKFQGGRPNFEGWKIMCPDMDIGFVL